MSDEDVWPTALKENASILSANEKELSSQLIALGQSHLLANWEPPGTNDDAKRALLVQMKELNDGYIGGLAAYISNARDLLSQSQAGLNPLEGWSPFVPAGVSIEPCTAEYNKFEERGLQEIGCIGFVLVAGGLGERLGYNNIKVGLPVQTITNMSYLEFYCRQILEIQNRYAPHTPNQHLVPLAIMVSDDTCSKTNQMLIDHNYFGLSRSQITLLKQQKVAAVTNSSAEIALSSRYTVDSKPHGHGDVHALMHQSGTAAEWSASGVRHVFFFQDTNGLAFVNLPALLGVSVEHRLDVNSLTVPRFAKQAVGAIAKLVHVDGRQLTVNVEYNQLDPLLRATGSPAGDVNNPLTGLSPFPGNTNQLLLNMETYIHTLTATRGLMPEFVNPKYADASKTTFKKPTRLECMMQDYPKLLGPEARVGFTTTPGWACYSPCKNNVLDAAASAAAGVPAAPPYIAECDQYYVFAEMLRRMGATAPAAADRTFWGIRASPGPCIVLSPETVMFPSDLRRTFPYPHNVFITPRSVLLVEGDVTVHSLRLDGAVRLTAEKGAVLTVHAGPGKAGSYCVVNEGYAMKDMNEMTAGSATDVADVGGMGGGSLSPPSSSSSASSSSSSSSSSSEVISMRGYVWVAKDVRHVTACAAPAGLPSPSTTPPRTSLLNPLHPPLHTPLPTSIRSPLSALPTSTTTPVSTPTPIPLSNPIPTPLPSPTPTTPTLTPSSPSCHSRHSRHTHPPPTITFCDTYLDCPHNEVSTVATHTTDSSMSIQKYRRTALPHVAYM